MSASQAERRGFESHRPLLKAFEEIKNIVESGAKFLTDLILLSFADSKFRHLSIQKICFE